MWDRAIFLRADVKAFFGRVCADGLSDSDVAAIVDQYSQRLTKRSEVCLHFLYIAASPHMRSLLLPERCGRSCERRKKTKQRSDSRHCVTRSMTFTPIPERMLTRGSRVVEKLKGEGWAEELEMHPSAYAALKDITGVRVAKPLTDKSTAFVDHPRHSLTT